MEEQTDPESAAAKRIAELVNTANKQTRGVARGLFPVRLEENGLVSALEELARDAGEFFNTNCEFHCEQPIVIEDHTMALHLYYIAQEAVINAVKHGKARTVVLRIAAVSGESFRLTVENDGAPLPPEQSRGRGMGIRIMKYRARMIGAAIVLQSLPKGGVEVVCEFICKSKQGLVRA